MELRATSIVKAGELAEIYAHIRHTQSPQARYPELWPHPLSIVDYQDHRGYVRPYVHSVGISGIGYNDHGLNGLYRLPSTSGYIYINAMMCYWICTLHDGQPFNPESFMDDSVSPDITSDTLLEVSVGYSGPVGGERFMGFHLAIDDSAILPVDNTDGLIVYMYPQDNYQYGVNDLQTQFYILNSGWNSTHYQPFDEYRSAFKILESQIDITEEPATVLQALHRFIQHARFHRGTTSGQPMYLGNGLSIAQGLFFNTLGFEFAENGNITYQGYLLTPEGIRYRPL